MIELNINRLTKYYGANKLFENISFEIKTGERIGLIGQNGCGKTTIMKILMGMEEYQEGEINLRKNNKLGYLNQIPIYDKDTTTVDVLRMAFEQIYYLQKQMEELEQKMALLEGELLEKTLKGYARLQEQYEQNHGYELQTKIDKITKGLQITDSMKEMLFDKLSGGEKTRVILAKILLEEPDLLLLDEPTNHLDLVSIEWLEGFLKEYKGASLIISHDRYFLDNVVEKLFELQYDHVDVYQGNYSYYVTEKERRFLIEYHNYQNQQKKIERMEMQIERYRIWGAMRDSETMYKRAKELEKRLEKIDVLKRPLLDKRKIRLDQTSVGRSGKMVLEVDGLGKSFGERQVLSDISFQVFYQDSVCIIGENGSGKTTLIKMILGDLEQEEGTVKIGAQVILGYLPQQVTYPDEEQTVLEYFAGLHNLTNGAARSLLAKALFFKEDVNKKIKSLSGGEKSRLRLCSLTFKGANLLILDEPTNHLDVASREVLEQTLSEFEGTLLFVSHDRYFIEKLVDRIIKIEDGSTRIYEGNYSYYQEEQQKEIDRNEHLAQTNTGKAAPAKRESNMASEKEEKHTGKIEKQSVRKIELLEKVIDEMESRRKNIEEQMNDYSSDVNRLSELYDEKSKLEQELETCYSEWEMLQ